jgi:hypothetical protein
VKSWQWNLALFILASPILAVRGTVRLVRRARLLYQAARPTMPCGTCGEEISLVGLWRCRCGYTYQGHVLRYCPVCGAFPLMVRCYQCGTTERVLM